MQLTQNFNTPVFEDACFHFALFQELCSESADDAARVASAAECLVDAAREIVRVATEHDTMRQDSSPVLLQLAGSEMSFRKHLPELFKGTRAARGFAALRDLAGTASGAGRCRDREARSVTLGDATRFVKTLGAFVFSLRANVDRNKSAAFPARQGPFSYSPGL